MPKEEISENEENIMPELKLKKTNIFYYNLGGSIFLFVLFIVEILIIFILFMIVDTFWNFLYFILASIFPIIFSLALFAISFYFFYIKTDNAFWGIEIFFVGSLCAPIVLCIYLIFLAVAAAVVCLFYGGDYARSWDGLVYGTSLTNINGFLLFIGSSLFSMITAVLEKGIEIGIIVLYSLKLNNETGHPILTCLFGACFTLGYQVIWNIILVYNYMTFYGYPAFSAWPITEGDRFGINFTSITTRPIFGSVVNVMISILIAVWIEMYKITKGNKRFLYVIFILSFPFLNHFMYDFLLFTFNQYWMYLNATDTWLYKVVCFLVISPFVTLPFVCLSGFLPFVFSQKLRDKFELVFLKRNN